MKELKCEMCGSSDVIKQDGLFVCQVCNTKYSVEEARKMMGIDVMQIGGTVSIDNSSELNNLYEIARRAKNTNNSENALNYYDQILVKDPNSWEAQFYVVYFRAMQCRIIEIAPAANSISNCIEPVLNLVKEYVGENEQGQVVSEIYERCVVISEMLNNASYNTYMDIDINIRDDFVQEYLDRVINVVDLLYNLGNKLTDIFGDTYSQFAVNSWKQGIDIHKSIISKLADQYGHKAIIRDFADKIKKYDATYVSPY